MTSVSEVASISRNLLRDFGIFFETNFAGSLHSTLRLPHPLVDADSLVVIDNDTGDEVTDPVLNARAGLLKLADPSSHTEGVSVSGMYYQWFLDEDLLLHAQIIVSEHLHNRTGVTLDNISAAEEEVMGIGAVVSALWSLAAEFSTDIDVSSPEGMNIPAHQRFQQLLQLIQFWEKRYNEKAALLNVGLHKTEMFTLRRISRLTNRYVPVYRGREVDDPRRPVRVRPPIDPIAPTPMDQEEAYWNSQYPEMDTGSQDLAGGWSSIGSSGA